VKQQKSSSKAAAKQQQSSSKAAVTKHLERLKSAPRGLPFVTAIEGS
jgi:hypothetical protein